MIKIKKILISGFKSENVNVEIIFNSDISVLYGPNGCGKTTILRILHAVFSHDAKILTTENIESVEVIYLIDGEDVKVSVVKIKNEYIWISLSTNDKDIDPNCMLFGVNRGITTNITNNMYPEYIEDFFYQYGNKYKISKKDHFRITRELSDFIDYKIRNENLYNRRTNNSKIRTENKNLIADEINMEGIEILLVERYRVSELITSDRVQNALFETLSLAIQENIKLESDIYDNPEFMSNVFKHKERLIDILSRNTNNLSLEIVSSLKKIDDDGMEIFRDKPLLCNLIQKMICELNDDKEMMESVNRVVEVFNNMLGNNKKLIVKANSAYIMLNNGETHSLSQLSSGERHILTILVMFIIDGMNRDILMIDEPEISLNIEWQRKLLTLFKEINPNIQIIVATHSPSIAQDIFDLTEIKTYE